MSAKTLNLTEPLRAYLLDVGVREDAVLASLRERTAALPEARMQICAEQGALLTLLTRLLGARRALEVGTFTGYSSICIARGLADGGRLTCCDVSDTWTSMAREAWSEAGVADRVELRLAPAVETLDALLADGHEGTFDLAFVDADKESYLAYHERALRLLRPGGVALYDNVLWGGSVLDDEDQRPSTVAIRAFNRALAGDERVDLVLVPIGDGLTVARRR
ncbi:MAG: class I SAM-dependent methyltransferase [Alphaproteobacteria bacterium]|nr:class I SAM-dependent methyltransferase [Alphaproteobacteria bacterium]MCB9699188.1 class I SAM-dependent methyltransferase [Alphaproteobacteria bacterium]